MLAAWMVILLGDQISKAFMPDLSASSWARRSREVMALRSEWDREEEDEDEELG